MVRMPFPQRSTRLACFYGAMTWLFSSAALILSLFLRRKMASEASLRLKGVYGVRCDLAPEKSIPS
jgi:hypothetical protein